MQVNYRMMRKILVATIGIVQVIIGISSIIFVYLYNYDKFDFPVIFNLPPEETSFYLLIFLAFCLFSLISGLSFIQEWRNLVKEEKLWTH